MMLNIACIFAQALAQVIDAEQANGQVLARSYRQRAVAAIRLTLEMLPATERLSFWKTKIVPDPALAPVRRDGFARLEREFFPSKSK
jgi:hypothetical protein